MSDENANDSALEDPPANNGSETGESGNDALLSGREARILGSLMEKQMATPDGYPLTVNSLLNACNQKSSRDPVTNLQQGEVVRSLRELESRKLVRYEMGARSERYEQTLTNYLSLSRKQQALLCVMLLRGPQTANELQTRTQRLYTFENRDDMLVSLTRMTQGDSPVAALIGRSTGQRDDRYGHLLCGADYAAVAATSASRNDTESTTTESTSTASRQSSAAQSDMQNNETAAANAKTIALLTDEILELREQLEELYRLTGHTLPPN